MKKPFCILTLLLFQSTLVFGQKALGQAKKHSYLSIIGGDTLIGKYQNHLPIEGKFEQLKLWRYPSGVYKYTPEISGEYKAEKLCGTWTYWRLEEWPLEIDLEKKVYFYKDSTIIKGDFGKIKYDSDSSNVEASILGMRSEVKIKCKDERCIFQSLEASRNKFCFQQEHLDSVIFQLREGHTEVAIFRALGQNCP